MRILIIEDDADTSDFLKVSLEAEGYNVDVEEDGIKGSFTARTNDYDLAIIDYSLPKRTGLEICKDIRAADKAYPIIILSVVGTVANKVNLLKNGADDYLTKPFSFEELMARIKVLLRRPAIIEKKELRIGDLILNTQSLKVKRANKSIYLTKKEFSFLEYLLKNKGKVVSRGMIMEHVWSMESDPFSNTIESHVLNLRRKINIKGKKNYIFNIPGRGYKIDDEK